MAQYRLGRLGEEMKKELSDIIRYQLDDPRLSMVSILRVDVTKDLRYARVFISALTQDTSLDEIADILTQSKGYIRKELAKRIKVRYIPEPLFVADDSIAYGMKISKIIDECIQDDEERAVREGQQIEEGE